MIMRYILSYGLIFALASVTRAQTPDQYDYYCIFTNQAAAQADSVVGAYWNATASAWNTSVTFPNHKVTTAAALIIGISPITGFQIVISTVGPNASLAANSACFMALNRDAACRSQAFVVAAANFTGTNRTNATLSPVPMGSCYPRPLGQFNDASPPSRYDHDFPGKLIVRHASAFDTESLCHGAPACSYGWGDACLVYLPWEGIGGVGPRTYTMLRRHEVAHCNGWAAGHPE